MSAVSPSPSHQRRVRARPCDRQLQHTDCSACSVPAVLPLSGRRNKNPTHFSPQLLVCLSHSRRLQRPLAFSVPLVFGKRADGPSKTPRMYAAPVNQRLQQGLQRYHRKRGDAHTGLRSHFTLLFHHSQNYLINFKTKFETICQPWSTITPEQGSGQRFPCH